MNNYARRVHEYFLQMGRKKYCIAFASNNYTTVLVSP